MPTTALPRPSRLGLSSVLMLLTLFCLLLLGFSLPAAQAQTTGQVKYFPRTGYESRMTGGLFQGSTDNSTWTTLYTVSAKPSDVYTTGTFTVNPTTFRYLRYLGPANSDCNVAEIEFDSVTAGAATKLTGTGFGTPGSYGNSGNDFTKALDGSSSTFFDSPIGTGSFVGIDRGAPAPDFSLSAAPATLSIPQGTSKTATVSLTNLNGFTGSVLLTASGLPTGVTAAFAPASVSGTATSTLTLTAGATATVGTASVTITGTSGSLSHTATVALTVTASPILTSIVVSPATASLSLNKTQAFTALAKDQNGTALSPQPSFTWSVASGVGTVSATGLYASGAAPGSASVKAASGTVSGTAAVTVTNAAPTVAAAAKAGPSPATGKTTALSVLGADDGGEAGLTYTWATTGTPPASVTFSANSTNAAKNTTATFTKAGSYGLQVTIKDGGGLTTTSAVSVTVSQTLTSIAVSPAAVTLTTGGTQTFTASAKDQFGAALSTQPALAWSVVSGGVGSITSGGVYSAGSSAGSATVKATSGTISGPATVTVNSSGASISAPTQLVATASDGDVSLYWTGSAGATGYNVYRSTISGSGYAKVTTSPTPDQAYEDDTVSDGITYYYVVTAVSGASESAFSNEVSSLPTLAFNLSAVSTGSGKITLYWDDPAGTSNGAGYNVYRGTTTGGEDYGHPVNGSVPVTTLSYPNGNTHIFTDIGLTNGQQYFYTVKAVVGAGLSAASNEDNDYVDPQAIPWDTKDPSQIIAAAAKLSSEPIDTSGDVIHGMGPDGAVYDNGNSLEQAPDAIPSPDSNVWDLKDGTSVAVPEDNNSIPPDGVAASFLRETITPELDIANAGANGTPTMKNVPVNTGPLRRVVSQPGFVKASILVTLPPSGNINQAPYKQYPASYVRTVTLPTKQPDGSIKKVKQKSQINSTGDTPYIYMGSFGTVVNASGQRVVKATVDAGLQYQRGNFYVFIGASGSRDPYVSSVFAATDPVNQYFTLGDQVRMTYFLQNPTGVPQRSKTLVWIKVESQTSEQPPIEMFTYVDSHPTNGSGVVLKRVTSIAQTLAKQNGDYQQGYRKRGSYLLNETLQSGSLYSTATGSPLSWSSARTLTTFEGFAGSLFFPSGVVSSSILTAYSYETNLDVDLR